MKTLHQRLAAAMARVDYIQKEKKAGMRYSIVSHDAVTAKVRPVLLDEGIVYYPTSLVHGQNGNRTEVNLTVRFANIDNPHDCIDVPSLGYGIDDQDKGPGKAISYAVKYALLKALGLETGDDPDTDQEAVHRPAPRAAAPRTSGFHFDPREDPREPIHDPETGELPPGNNGTPAAWVDGIKDRLGPGASKRRIAEEYAAMLIEKAGKFKPHKLAHVWIVQFEQTHEKYIDKLDGDLKRLVSDALAEARDRATNPNHDPAMFRDVGPLPDDFMRAG